MPLDAMEAMCKVLVPVFFRTTDFAALVTPTRTEPRFKVVGVKLTAGDPLLVVTLMAAVVPVTTPATVSLAVMVCDPVVCNVTVKVLIPALLLVKVKSGGRMAAESLLVKCTLPL